jgi:hypothetical protein
MVRQAVRQAHGPEQSRRTHHPEPSRRANYNDQNTNIATGTLAGPRKTKTCMVVFHSFSCFGHYVLEFEIYV